MNKQDKIKKLKKQKNSLVRNLAIKRLQGTGKPKSKSTINKKEFAKLKTYK